MTLTGLVAIENFFLLSCLPILSPSSFASWCDVIRKLISPTQHRHCKWVASNKTPLAVCLFWACIWSLCRYSTSWGRQLEIYRLHCRLYLAQVPWHIGLPDFSLFETRMTVQWLLQCHLLWHFAFGTLCTYCICRFESVSEETAIISGHSIGEIRNRDALCFLEAGWICRSVSAPE